MFYEVILSSLMHNTSIQPALNAGRGGTEGIQPGVSDVLLSPGPAALSACRAAFVLPARPDTESPPWVRQHSGALS